MDAQSVVFRMEPERKKGVRQKPDACRFGRISGLLFYDQIHNPFRHADRFDELFAFDGFLHLRIGEGEFAHRIRIGAGRHHHADARFALNLDHDFDLILFEFGLIEFGPRGQERGAS